MRNLRRHGIERRAGCVFAAVAAVLALSVHAVTAPTLKAVGFCNGKLTVCVARTAILDATLEVQMKDLGAADDAYVTIATKTGSSLSFFYHNSYDGGYFTYTTNFAGTATLRMRTTSGDEVSEWVAIGDVSAYVNVKGTAIGTATTFNNAVDGDMFSMVDESSSPWIGYDFGESIRIRGIRFYPRPDLMGRIYGAQVQYASDSSFSDAVVAYTAASGMSNSRVTDIFFEEPVDARCVRILSGVGGSTRSSVCEFEVVPADAPWKPTITVSRDDITNFYPKVEWSVPAELSSTSVDVLRATSIAGPYTAIAPGVDLSQYNSYTDTTAKVGIYYYYRLRADCNHPAFSGQTVISQPVAYRRWRRLDRSWSDEAHLYEGISIMKATNGTSMVTGGHPITHTFDGDVSTFADLYSAVFTHGPVGLDFGEKAWVGAVGYVCRNDNWCYVRVKNGALFCASGEDVELKDKVLCSDKMAASSQDTRFYYQEGTSMPGAGAPCWFLYGHNVDVNGFCCNVAELMFFGWTQHDIDEAGIVAAPDSLSLARSADGLAVVASWSAGICAANYRLERRARGAAEWTSVATVPGAVLTCNDTSVSQGYWEYRVVAISPEGDESASAAYSYSYYAPGNGTGLKGSIYAPYVANSAALSNPTSRWDIPVGAVDLSVNYGDDFVAGTGVKNNAYLLWRGKIIAPFEGSYDFTLETSDGGALYIDGVSVANSWTGGTKTPSGSIDLTVGEHMIEVDARLQNNIATLPPKCILHWGGVAPSEVVPATQLIPADSALLECDGWDVRYFNGTVIGKPTKNSNGYKITAAPQSPESRDRMNGTFLAKPWRYSLDVSAYVQSFSGGRGGLMVRRGDGNLFAVQTDYDGSGNAYCVVSLVTNGTNTVSLPIGRQKVHGFSNQNFYLRLVREFDTGRFAAYWKDDGEPDWHLAYEWIDDGSFKGDCEYGLLVTGFTPNKLSGFLFSEISVDTSRPGMTIIFR